MLINSGVALTTFKGEGQHISRLDSKYMSNMIKEKKIWLPYKDIHGRLKKVRQGIPETIIKNYVL